MGLEPDRRPAGSVARTGAEPLRDPGLDLQPVRVVEADQPMGGVEDRRARPVVPAEDDGPGARGYASRKPRMLLIAAPRKR